jgi:DNA-binding transcriptional MocR family regulator
MRIALDRGIGVPPYFQQIRAHIRDAVVEGSLPPGIRLPPERQLAAMLGVSRATVMRAYQELVADGLLLAAPSRGTVVARLDDGPTAGNSLSAAADGSWMLGLPTLAALGTEAGALREIVSTPDRNDLISFASSAPPDDLVPVGEITRALDAAFAEQGAKLLSYGPVDGMPELRTAITERMRSAGALAGGDSVIVLSGSTQGLALAARVLVEPGDEVVVEAPTYIGTVQTFELAGARLIGVPVDAEGIRTDAVEEVLARRRIRLMVLQPNFHNPTGASLSQARRERVLWLARRYGVPILEDDAYGALYYDAPAPASLKQLDRHGLVVYLSSLSKTLAPGLRVAWMCAPEPVIGRVALAKQFSDLNTNRLGQAVAARLISSGAYDANLDLLRGAARARMHTMLRQLDQMSDVLDRDLDPRGGLHVWCRLRTGDSQTAAAAAARAGVSLLGGTAFYARGLQGTVGRDRIRLSLPAAGPESIAVGCERLHGALQSLPRRVESKPPRHLSVVV